MSGGLSVDVGLSHPDSAFRLDAQLEAADGETLALLGPNGVGKTSLLRAIAGLARPDRGAISYRGVPLFDAADGVDLAAAQRDVGYVFQDSVLFPHLSVSDNVAFGLRARGRSRAEARTVAREWLERVGLAAAGDRRPASLSGGEAQRVALARALAPEPRVLLLDEPLAALDASVRAHTRRELRRHLVGHDGVRIVVTHDAVDAAALADRVAVLDSGAVTQVGTLAEIRAQPRGQFAADLVGVNLYPGRATAHGVELEGGPVLVAPAAGALPGDVFAVVHPRAVALSRTRPEGSARNVWEGQVVAVESDGDRARVQLSGSVPVVAEVTAAAAEALALRPGAVAWVAVKATEIDVFPR